jgi:kynureninase
MADADHALAVTDDDERGELEPTTALDDLRDAVDRDDPLVILLAVGVSPAASTVVPAAPAAALAATLVRCHVALSCHRRPLWADTSSELEPRLARRIGERRDPAGVAVAAPVEHAGADARVLRPLTEASPDLPRDRALVVAIDTILVRARPRPRVWPTSSISWA